MITLIFSRFKNLFRSKPRLDVLADRLKGKYDITDVAFDSACIYFQGDLSELLRRVLPVLLPGEHFQITEAISEDAEQYMASITYNNQQITTVTTHTTDEYLTSEFYDTFETIPLKMPSQKLFCMIEPHLTGQVAWYVCGTLANLKSVKKKGLPIMLPGERLLLLPDLSYLILLMAYSEKLADRIRERFAGLKVEEKQMMGGLTFMLNDKMCVGIFKGDLMCRIDPDMYASALKKKGCHPMDMAGRIMKGFVIIDETGRKSQKDFDYWVGLAIHYNSKAKKSPRKKK